jgi:1-deoxy-D-xylulose-5-phosphate reductoisomerase
MRRVSVFGATGSIGQNTLDLIARAPDDYRRRRLRAARNIARLAEDARRLNADVAVTAYEDRLGRPAHGARRLGGRGRGGQGALIEAADRPADWIMSAIVGAAGWRRGSGAAHGTTLALANKESLVTAGPLLLAEARAHGATILPVDSEHSAIFQGLVGEEIEAVEKIIVTASGGGLRDWPLEALPKATVADAGAHPNWDMGQRITIDSASMFNKAMELIETKEFFGVPIPRRSRPSIHPAIHRPCAGRVPRRGADGACRCAGHAPRHRLRPALARPARLARARLDLAQIATLEFYAPDLRRYPALGIARARSWKPAGSAGCVPSTRQRNARSTASSPDRIGFMDMAGSSRPHLTRSSSRIRPNKSPIATLEDVLATDHMARSDGLGPHRKSGAAWNMEFIPDFGGLAFTLRPSSPPCRSSWRSTNTVITSSGGGLVSTRKCSRSASVRLVFSRVDRHGTKWQIAALPFGGYVKFLGDADAASGKDGAAIDALDVEERRRSMHGAPLWARSATVAAGPVFNFIAVDPHFRHGPDLRGTARR